MFLQRKQNWEHNLTKAETWLVVSGPHQHQAGSMLSNSKENEIEHSDLQIVCSNFEFICLS